MSQFTNCVLLIVDDISPSGRLDTNFGPFDQLVAADYIYDVSSSVVDDAGLEGDEGFILYFDFSDSSNNPSDLARLEAGNRAILVTILDDDGEVSVIEAVPNYCLFCFRAC